MSGETLNVDTFSNLDQLLSPFYYGPELEIPPPPPGTLSVPAGLQAQSRLAENCQWGYSFNGPVIRCFPVSHPNPLLGRSHVPLTISTSGYHFPNAIITCAVELSIINERVERGIRRLLLGLDCGPGGGCLVIFDTVKGHPLRWITTPLPVESLVIIRHFESGSVEDPLLGDIMEDMNGIAGVGLSDGEFILVDLGLDDLREELRNYKLDFTKPTQQRNTFDLVPLDPEEPSFRLRRRELMEEKHLMFVDFHNQHFAPEDGYDDVDLFYYCDASGELVERLRKSEVHVTAMAYFPSIGSIIIGFNFGSFQIWRLETLQLEFSSPFQGRQGLPVTSFEFQTPVDDPRNFCYLWILTGSTTKEFRPAKLELYALEYELRSTLDRIPIYRDLKHCCCKLGFYLQDSYMAEDEGGNGSLLESHRDTLKFRHFVRPLRMFTSGCGKETLLFVSWESSRPTHSYLGIFDLNQWYSAQTPDQVPIQLPTTLCPFWASFTFGCPGIPTDLFDVRLIKGTFTRWVNTHLHLPIHAYPTSITFQSMVLSSRGSYTFEQFSIQEMGIRLIQKEGQTLMAKPGPLRGICDMIGLRPQLMSNYLEDSTEKSQYYILSAVLESMRPSLIVQMANSWLDGSYVGLGLSLSLILQWIHSFASLVRSAADPHWEVLLRPSSSSDLPPDTYRFLHYSHSIWNQQKGLLWTLLRCDLPDATDEEYDLQFGVEKLVQYSGSLLMLHRASILPLSHSPTDMTQLLGNYYAQRREETQSALDKSPFIHPTERGGHPLLIDYLFENLDEEFLREEWELGPGEPFYPPKHPGHILNFFLGTWINIPQHFIGRILFYYFLDLIHNQGQGGELVGDFHSIISLSVDEQSKVETLWMIDHGQLSQGVARLSRMRIDDEKEGFPWAAGLVLLAAQGQHTSVLNIIQENSIPPKISRFAFSLASTLEPNAPDLLRSIILGFCTQLPTFFNLLQMADEQGFLDSLILSEMYRSSYSVQKGVASYLESAPKTVQNQIRLLRLFISSRNIEEGISLYRILWREWRDRRLLPESDRRALEEAEIGLKKLMTLSVDTFGTLPRKKHKMVVEEPCPSPPPQSCRSSGEYTMVPAQLRRLMKEGMEMKGGQTPLSPLKRFVGRIHRPERDKAGETPTGQISPSDGGDHRECQLESSPDEPCQEGQVDLNQLLRTPPVNHSRGGRGTPLSTTILPSSGPSGESPVGTHKSSIKKKENGLRQRLLRTRFLDLSGLSPVEVPTTTGESGLSFGDESGEEGDSVGGSGSTEPFSPVPEDDLFSPPSAFNHGFQLDSDEDGLLSPADTQIQLGEEEIPETGPLPYLERRDLNEGEFQSDSSIISNEFRELRETVIEPMPLEDRNVEMEEVVTNEEDLHPETEDPSNVFGESGGVETVLEMEESQSSISSHLEDTCLETGITRIPDSAPTEYTAHSSKSSSHVHLDVNGSFVSGEDDDEIPGSVTESRMYMGTDSFIIGPTPGSPESPETELVRESLLTTSLQLDREEEAESGRSEPESGLLDAGFLLGRDSEEETLLDGYPITSQPGPPMPALSPQSSTQVSPTKSDKSVEGDSSFGIVTRSRARHLSEATYLAEQERSFLGHSLSTPGVDESMNTSGTPGRMNWTNDDIHMPTLIPNARAQSEPRGGEKVKRTRRSSMSEPAEPVRRVTRSGSVPKALDTPTPKGRGKKRNAGQADLSLDTSTDSANLSQLNTTDLSSSVAEIPKGRGRGKKAQQVEESPENPHPTTLTHPPVKRGKGQGRKKSEEETESVPPLEKPVRKTRSRKKGEEVEEEIPSILESTNEEPSQGNQGQEPLPSTSAGIKPKRKPRLSSVASEKTSGETGRSTRSKSEEPSPTPPQHKRRRSSSEGRDLDSSSFNQSFSIGEADGEGDEWSETSIGDTSFTEGRRRVFDYAPSLSTVLEVTETSSGGNTPTTVSNTPMTRLRRRSLRSSTSLSMGSIQEGEEEESLETGDGEGGKRKRSRRSSTITPIEEEDSTPPEPSRRRLRLDPPESNVPGEEDAATPTNANPGGVSGRKKKRTRTSPRTNN